MAFCGLPWMLKILGSYHLFGLELWLPALLHLWYLHSVLTSAGGDICWASPSLSICRYSPNSTNNSQGFPRQVSGMCPQHSSLLPILCSENPDSSDTWNSFSWVQTDFWSSLASTFPLCCKNMPHQQKVGACVGFIFYLSLLSRSW